VLSLAATEALLNTKSRLLVLLAVALGLSACGSGGRSASEAGSALPDGGSSGVEAALAPDAANAGESGTADRSAVAEGGHETATLPSDVGVDITAAKQDTAATDTVATSHDVGPGTDSLLSPQDSAEAVVRSDATEAGLGRDAGGNETSTGPADAKAADTASSAGDAPPATLGELSPQQLHDMLVKKDFLLIDVHTPNAGSVPGTDARIAYTDIAGLVDFIGSNLDTKVVLTCLSGGMSKSASNALVARGYRNVWELTGGTTAWTNAGYPLVYIDAGT